MMSIDQLYKEALHIMTGGNVNLANEDIYIRAGQSIYKYGIIFIIAYLIYWTMSPGDFFEIFMALIISIMMFYLVIIPLNEMILQIDLHEEGL
jgi:hypothetical protein